MESLKEWWVSVNLLLAKHSLVPTRAKAVSANPMISMATA
jgi:hypothetical protein